MDFAESEQPGRYGPPVLVSEARRVLCRGLLPRELCTSHDERNNLTIRTFMRRFGVCRGLRFPDLPSQPQRYAVLLVMAVAHFGLVFAEFRGLMAWITAGA